MRLLDPYGEPMRETPAQFVIKRRAGVPDDCAMLVVEATTDDTGWVVFAFDRGDMTFSGRFFYRADSLPGDEVHTHARGRLDVLPA